jgi:hypothetical protein
MMASDRSRNRLFSNGGTARKGAGPELRAQGREAAQDPPRGARPERRLPRRRRAQRALTLTARYPNDKGAGP